MRSLTSRGGGLLDRQSPTACPKFRQELKAFFSEYGVKSTVASQGNMGCPHEEGKDFPLGEDCPFCPFWKGKQGSNQRE